MNCVQVVISVAPEELLDELDTRFLRGELAALAAHPCANFVVQALAGAAARPQQARRLCEVALHLRHRSAWTVSCC